MGKVRSKSRKSSSNLNLAEQLNGMKNLPVDIDPPAPVDLSVATELVTDTNRNQNVTQNIEEPENGAKRKKKKVRSKKIKPDDESTIAVEPNFERDEPPVKNLENPGNVDNVTIAEIPNVVEQNNEEDEKTVKKRRKVRSRKSKSTVQEGNQGLEILPVPVITNADTRNPALDQEDALEKIENEQGLPDKNVEIPIESDIPDSEFKNDDESAGNFADNESEEVVKKRKKKKVRSKKSATRDPEGDQPLEVLPTPLDISVDDTVPQDVNSEQQKTAQNDQNLQIVADPEKTKRKKKKVRSRKSQPSENLVTQSFENLETEKTEIENNQSEPNILKDGQESLKNPDITADPEDTGTVKRKKKKVRSRKLKSSEIQNTNLELNLSNPLIAQHEIFSEEKNSDSEKRSENNENDQDIENSPQLLEESEEKPK